MKIEQEEDKWKPIKIIFETKKEAKDFYMAIGKIPGNGDEWILLNILYNKVKKLCE